MPMHGNDGRPTNVDDNMNDHPTLSELESRWETTLQATRTAAANRPREYRQLKSLAAEIVAKTIDINDYFPIVDKLVNQLEWLDPMGAESIFAIFRARILPSDIWQVKQLRLECRDLLAHLNAFDEWRRKQHGLRCVK